MSSPGSVSARKARPTAPLHRWLRRARQSDPALAERLSERGLDAALVERIESAGAPVGLPQLLGLVAALGPVEGPPPRPVPLAEDSPVERLPRRRSGSHRRRL